MKRSLAFVPVVVAGFVFAGCDSGHPSSPPPLYLFSEQKQADVTDQLDRKWADRSTPHFELVDGQGMAKIYIPALGQNYRVTIVEGTTQADLATGPGHYPGSALPGQPGNFAIDGYRVGQGAPFTDLDQVQSCDAIVVETHTDWSVYRMLPKRSEVAGWADGKGATAPCSGTDGDAAVRPLDGKYSQTVGQEVVPTSEDDVVAPIPHDPGTTLPSSQQLALMTMTTTVPPTTTTSTALASQLLVVHAVLVQVWPKNSSTPNQVPPELKKTR